MIRPVTGPTEGEEALLLKKNLLFISVSFISPSFSFSSEESRFHPLFIHAQLYFIGWFVCVCVCVCVCACLSELLCFKTSARGRNGFCYLCSRPLSGTEGLSGRRKGLLKECREGGNTLSPAACGKLLPMRRHSFAYDPFSSERKMRCGESLSLYVSVCRWSVCRL